MIVLPMAGLSRRFSEAGYALPKYMLTLDSRSLFSHALLSFKKYFASETFLIIARDVAETKEFLERELRMLGLAESKIVMLQDETVGQADTVGIGLDTMNVGDATPITIFNIDTFRPGFSYPQADWFGSADGYLEVMIADDPGYSYVLPSELGEQRVRETAEKRVISNLASTGLYHFARAGDFMSTLATARNAQQRVELYVAPLYNDLINRGLDVRYFEIPESEVIFCGIPAQYEALLQVGDV